MYLCHRCCKYVLDMTTTRRVAVVTGSNKGIGLEVIKGLCKNFDGDVILTARNEALGQEAVKKLVEEGLSPKFHQLDVCDNSSIEQLRDFLQKIYGGLDILVNNAGICLMDRSVGTLAWKVETTVKTNFWGVVNVCKSLFPLLKPHARVVNVSSRAAHGGAQHCSDELKSKFDDTNLTVADVEQIMTDYVSSVKRGDYAEKGWPDFPPFSEYHYSKIGLTLLSFAQQREFDKEPREDLVVNVCCPGYVSTDMNQHTGPRSVEDGADTLIYLALLPPNVAAPKGVFVGERKEIPFKGPDFAFDWTALGISQSEVQEKMKATQAATTRAAE